MKEFFASAVISIFAGAIIGGIIFSVIILFFAGIDLYFDSRPHKRNNDKKLSEAFVSDALGPCVVIGIIIFVLFFN